MHREVDRAGEQRFLDFLGEQPLAAGFAQRAILDAVARGADRDDLALLLAQAVRAAERGAHQVRLRERERAAARADANRLRHGTSGCYAERKLIARVWSNKLSSSASRRPATKPRRPWCGPARTGAARSSPISCCRRTTRTRPMAAWFPKLPRGPTAGRAADTHSPTRGCE